MVHIDGSIYEIVHPKQPWYKRKKAKSLDEILNKIAAGYYKRDVETPIVVSISNTRASNSIDRVDENGISIEECKNMMSKNSMLRYLYISGDMSEIYSETIYIDNKDHMFDYGLLYGKFRYYKTGGIIVSNYPNILMKMSSFSNMFEIYSTRYADPCIRLYPNGKHENDIHNAYLGYLVNVYNRPELYTAPERSLIPVSSFIKKIGSNV